MNSHISRALAIKSLRIAFLGGASTLALAMLASPCLAQALSGAGASASDAPLQGGASTLALAAMSGTGAAQDQSLPSPSAPNTVQEVVVTGLRGSLQKSLNVKRDAVGVVDAVSAEDIGKFPDASLAGAMERIPGVTVSYGMSSMGTTSNGDATEITVRGFGPSFNETLYDGRMMSSGLSARGFDFSSVSSDFVQEIDVLKTPDASLSSGAIGATINILFPKPLDHPGPRASGSFSEDYSQYDGHAAPNGSILLSDTFAHDTIGILADFDISNHDTLANHLNVAGWEGFETPAGPAWYPQEELVDQEHTKESRVDGRFVLQWRPSDNILFTLNDDYSRDSITQNQYGYGPWFSSGGLTNITRAPDGTVTNFISPATVTNFDSSINRSVLENNEVGFNTKWKVNNKFKLDLDVDHSESWLDPDGEDSSVSADIGYGPSNPAGTNGVNLGVTGLGPNNLPYFSAYGPNGNTALFNDPALMGSHVFPITSPRNYDAVNQAKLEGTWSEDHLKIRFGAQYVDDAYHMKSYDDFTNNQWQAYAGYGAASGNYYTGCTSPNVPAGCDAALPAGVLKSPAGAALPASFFTQSFSTANFIPGFGNANAFPSQVMRYSASQVLHYLQGLGNPATTYIPGFNYGCCNPAYTGLYSLELNPSSFQVVREETIAEFLDFAYDTDVADRPLKVNLGVRYEQTRVKSTGLGQEPLGLAVEASDHTAFNVAYGPVAAVSAGNNYNYFLPNLDVNYMLTPKLKLRFDASRTLTRPPLGDLTPVVNLSGSERVGALVASGGNPSLMPYLSDNFDFGAEWYYQHNSYISIDGFVKNVTNFIVGGTTRMTFPGVIDPTTNQLAQFNVTSQVNGPAAQVRGVEVALQHVFGETGFGLQTNATFVDTDKPYNPNDLSVSGFAVTGLANSANLVGFYDKHGFQARVAVNWRDTYLDHFGQAQNNSLFGTEPTFVNAATYVDFSTSYDINSHLQVYFEGLNLTDQVYSTHGRFPEQILDVVDTGREFKLGFHLKM